MKSLFSKKWIQWLLLMSFIIVIVLSCLVIKYYYNREIGVEIQQFNETKNVSFEDIPPSPLDDSYYQNWKKYSDDNYGFEIFYPQTEFALDDKKLNEKNIFWINKITGSPYPIRVVREENKEQKGIESYFSQEIKDVLIIEENYDVVIRGNSFRHLMALGQGVSLLQWYIVNNKGEIFILSAEQDPTLNPHDNEQRTEILKIFSTFSFIK